MSAAFGRSLKSLDRTYEELKHTFQRRLFIAVDQGLDRTYEELKPFSSPSNQRFSTFRFGSYL
mgnify:CR=1 FL=1